MRALQTGRLEDSIALILKLDDLTRTN
jgi:hypothetical protein